MLLVTITALLRLVVVASATTAGVFLALTLFDWLTPGLDEWREVAAGNTAVAIVMAAVLIAMGIIIRPIITFSFDAFDVGTGIVVRVLFAEGLRIMIGLLLSALTLAFAVALYNTMTGAIDEKREISLGNTAVAVLEAGVLLTLALIVSAPATDLTASIVALLFG